MEIEPVDRTDGKYVMIETGRLSALRRDAHILRSALPVWYALTGANIRQELRELAECYARMQQAIAQEPESTMTIKRHRLNHKKGTINGDS